MKKIAIPVLLTAMAGIVSCSKVDDCPDFWAVNRTNPNLIVEIDENNEALSIQMTDFAGTAGEVYQSYFTGEFNVIANFDNFTAPAATGTNGRPYIEMMMYNTNFPDTVLDTTAMRVGLSSTHIYCGIGVMQYQQKLRTATSGILRIQKQGTNLIAQTICGADTVTVTQNMSVAPVIFGFRVGSINDSAVTGTVGIKINQFNVIGNNGTTLYSDDFTCNSIYQ